MGLVKIKKILLYNFKNFRHETVIDFSDNMTFLVGPNGFGKTTIFDAIELGLTGDISRINQNNPVTGENIKYNKPFFQNDISEPVIIKLWLEKSNVNQLVLVRMIGQTVEFYTLRRGLSVSLSCFGRKKQLMKTLVA